MTFISTSQVKEFLSANNTSLSSDKIAFAVRQINNCKTEFFWSDAREFILNVAAGKDVYMADFAAPVDAQDEPKYSMVDLFGDRDC
jgi:hypothetical protein